MIILPGDMYDAIPSLVGNIPTDAYAVAGYVDSISFTWSQANWDRFPKSLKCTITTTGRVKAHFADRETGDLSPQQVYDLYQAGAILGVYCNYASWQSVQDVFNANRKPQPPYWIAEYPGGGRVMPVLNGIEAVAHQYYNSNLYDRSAITDTFVELIGGTVTTPADIWGYPIPSPDGKTSFAALDWLRYGDTYAGQSATNTQAILTQLAAIQGAIAKEEADFLGAIKALPAPVVQQITADPAAVAAALESAGLPTQIISSLLALLVKAAPTGGTA